MSAFWTTRAMEKSRGSIFVTWGYPMCDVLVLVQCQSPQRSPTAVDVCTELEALITLLIKKFLAIWELVGGRKGWGWGEQKRGEEVGRRCKRREYKRRGVGGRRHLGMF